ncbi:hypothetical protein IMZ48_31845 [Candidatus Bathyarchaeota archaeon]|nr:hypothetical protein [Candidatus Bathyarchaeota archaeon]
MPYCVPISLLSTARGHPLIRSLRASFLIPSPLPKYLKYLPPPLDLFFSVSLHHHHCFFSSITSHPHATYICITIQSINTPGILASIHMIRPFDERRLPPPRDGDSAVSDDQWPLPLQTKGRRRPIPSRGLNGEPRPGQFDGASPHDSGYGSAPSTPLNLSTPSRPARRQAGRSREASNSPND